MQHWRSLMVMAAAVILAAGLGGSAAATASTYEVLEQPGWAPPSWLFGPVWTVLYASIAYVGWRIWITQGWSATMRLWVAQLVMNAAWTPLFFGLDLRGLAFAWILGLLALIVWLIRRTWRIPGAILLPYAAWVAFASVLNGTIWWLNR